MQRFLNEPIAPSRLACWAKFPHFLDRTSILSLKQQSSQPS